MRQKSLLAKQKIDSVFFGITNQFTEAGGLSVEHEIRGILTLTLSTASTGSAILYFYTHEVLKIQKMSKIPTLGLPPPQALVVSWEGHDFERPCGIL